MKKINRLLSFILLWVFIAGIFVPSSTAQAAELSQYQQAEQVAAQLVQKHITSDMSVEEKYYALALLEQCPYDHSFASESFTAYGSLVKHKAVCSGMALAYQLLCEKAGLYCSYITSTKLNHAWNMIKIGNHYYHIDMQNVALGTFLWSDQQRFEGESEGRALMNGYQSIPVCDDGSKLLIKRNEKYDAVLGNRYNLFQCKHGQVAWDMVSGKNPVSGGDSIRQEYTITVSDSNGKTVKKIAMQPYDPDCYFNLYNWAYNDQGFTLVFQNYNHSPEVDQTAYRFNWNGDLISREQCDLDMRGADYQGVMYTIDYDESTNTSTLVTVDADLNSRRLAVFPDSHIKNSGNYFCAKNGFLYFMKHYGTTIERCEPGDLVKVDLKSGQSTTLLKNICCEWTISGYIRSKDTFGTAFCYHTPTKAASQEYLKDVDKYIYVI